jgi:signal transduction histidine kinase
MRHVCVFFNFVHMGQTQVIIVLIAATVSTLALLAGTVYFVIVYRRRRLEGEREIQLIEQQFGAALLQNAVDTQLETMAHIGREIHDNVGQKLTLANLYIHQVLLQASPVSDRLQEVAHLIDDSLRDLRMLSKTLAIDAYDEADFARHLRAACDAVGRLGKCKVVHRIDELGKSLNAETRLALFRITQEFFQNSLRHAGCKQIAVHCSDAQDCITLHLCDDGIGFDPEKASGCGTGLASMQTRVRLLGGSLVLNAAAGRGTEVIVSLPKRKLV